MKRASAEAEKLLLTAKSEALEILKEIKTAEADKAKELVKKLEHNIREIKEINESQSCQPLIPKLKVFPGKKVF